MGMYAVMSDLHLWPFEESKACPATLCFRKQGSSIDQFACLVHVVVLKLDVVFLKLFPPLLLTLYLIVLVTANAFSFLIAKCAQLAHVSQHLHVSFHIAYACTC